MKKLNFFKLLYVIVIICNCQIVLGQDIADIECQDIAGIEFEHTNHTIEKSILNQTVYVCTGNYAYAYHSDANCPGLGNCKGNISYTDEYNAVNNLNRQPCCRCWQNVSNNCKDDIATSRGGGGGRGGSDGSGEAVLAILIVAASAAILSNDFYLYPTYSFYKNPKYLNQNSTGIGWNFGFRKTFTKSALEYGLNRQSYQMNQFQYYNNPDPVNEWGFNLNYIHNIYESKMPEKINSYVGLSTNYFDEIGYGLIVGSKYELGKRFHLDLRYELTTQTNQLQLGIIFNYQRKYLWQK